LPWSLWDCALVIENSLERKRACFSLDPQVGFFYSPSPKKKHSMTLQTFLRSEVMDLTIHPLVPSRLVIDLGRMTYLRNYGVSKWLPCPFYVIKGGEEPVLVDTSGSAAVMSKLRVEPVEDIMPFETVARLG
jgi:hypothetical protein